MKIELILATGNLHKVKEIKEILGNTSYKILSALDLELPEVDEDQDSLQGNSLKKARVVAMATKKPAIADDTGLFVDALNGQPGIYAARYAGEGCSFADNRAKLLKELAGKSNRKAYFSAVITFCDAEGKMIGSCEGRMTGEIALGEKGDRGFGYDNIFIPDGYDKTLSELSSEQKNEISHRKKALIEISPIIEEYFANLTS